ncbi:MAG: hypothetical protein E7343_03320 [Clostridiales bacterium]|nr:hypothetical protein [Clostridiales bacterium]
MTNKQGGGERKERQSIAKQIMYLPFKAKNGARYKQDKEQRGFPTGVYLIVNEQGKRKAGRSIAK